MYEKFKSRMTGPGAWKKRPTKDQLNVEQMLHNNRELGQIFLHVILHVATAYWMKHLVSCLKLLSNS